MIIISNFIFSIKVDTPSLPFPSLPFPSLPFPSLPFPSLLSPINKVSQVIQQLAVVFSSHILPTERRVLCFRPHVEQIETPKVGGQTRRCCLISKHSDPARLGELGIFVVKILCGGGGGGVGGMGVGVGGRVGQLGYNQLVGVQLAGGGIAGWWGYSWLVGVQLASEGIAG